jgi:ABC-type branched-subunit amino acid transport system permease subunit
MIASSYTLAAIVTSLLVVVVGMPLGRRNSILLGNITIVFGGIIQAASFSVPQIIVARVICVRRVWSFKVIRVQKSLTLKH